jgi:hypothetical protein
MNCSIIVKGHLDEGWSEWFDGLTIVKQQNGETRLVGLLPDQCALYGLLTKMRDLRLALVQVQCEDE